jgi:hypothetical protein
MGVARHSRSTNGARTCMVVVSSLFVFHNVCLRAKVELLFSAVEIKVSLTYIPCISSSTSNWRSPVPVVITPCLLIVSSGIIVVSGHEQRRVVSGMFEYSIRRIRMRKKWRNSIRIRQIRIGKLQFDSRALLLCKEFVHE